MKRAAFLIRCSTSAQDWNRQIVDLRSVCRHFGFVEAGIYGEHITGKDNALERDRDSIKHIKEDRDKYDVILCAEVSRLSRDPLSGRVYISEFVNMGAPIFFKEINKWTIDPETGEHKDVRDIVYTLGGYFDAAYKYLKSMKTQIASGRRNILANGGISIGKPAFGYMKAGGTDKVEKNKLVINEEEAGIVRDIFKLYLMDGLSTHSLAKIYGRSSGWVSSILHYEPYSTGEIKVSIKDPDNGYTDTYNIPAPVLIDRETFASVAIKLAEGRTNTSARVSTRRALSKLIKCPHCGYSFTYGRDWTCGRCSDTVHLNDEKLKTILWALITSEMSGIYCTTSKDRVERIKAANDKIEAIRRQQAGLIDELRLYEDKVAKAKRTLDKAPEELEEEMRSEYFAALTSKKEAERRIDKEAQRLVVELDAAIRHKEKIESAAEITGAVDERVIREMIQKVVPYKTGKRGISVLEVFVDDGRYVLVYDAFKVCAWWLTMCEYRDGSFWLDPIAYEGEPWGDLVDISGFIDKAEEEGHIIEKGSD